MGKINSRAKGAVGEREWAKFLREHGRPLARRGVQHAGGPDSPDVVDPGAEEHWEVKRVESLSLYKAMVQSAKDAGHAHIPVVAHRRNNLPWLCILGAEDYLSMSNELALLRRDVGLE